METKERQFLFKGHELIISRTFNAAPARVFEAWTTAEELVRWWGPKDFTAPFCKIDLKVGGEFHFCTRSPYGVDFFSTGTFLEIIPGKKIVTTDSFCDSFGNIISAASVGLPGNWPTTLLITVTFDPCPSGTLFTLQHKGLPEEIVSSCMAGWKETLDKLEGIL
jgi:uncharacterized protein YndB with AHSA1/START domain